MRRAGSRTRGLIAALLASALLLGCGKQGPAPGAPIAEPYDGPDAVRPYTLEQQRSGIVVGQETLTEIRGLGEPMLSRSRVLSVDGEGYETASTMLDSDRKPILETSTTRWTFDLLPSYRPGTVVFETRNVTTKLGTFACWYIRAVNEDGSTEEAWYAKDLPPHPILLESRYASGKLIRRVERLEDSRVPPAAEAGADAPR